MDLPCRCHSLWSHSLLLVWLVLRMICHLCPLWGCLHPPTVLNTNLIQIKRMRDLPIPFLRWLLSFAPDLVAVTAVAVAIVVASVILHFQAVVAAAAVPHHQKTIVTESPPQQYTPPPHSKHHMHSHEHSIVHSPPHSSQLPRRRFLNIPIGHSREHRMPMSPSPRCQGAMPHVRRIVGRVRCSRRCLCRWRVRWRWREGGPLVMMFHCCHSS
mmetsp:Transcript_3699/g.6279  ORF Transcript_3699/g.6279 Transcript_3699/m.6279 type:complete len:213 (+) Transcript_3699:435-1073(+)